MCSGFLSWLKLHTFPSHPPTRGDPLPVWMFPFHPQLSTATSPECFSQLCCHNKTPETGYLHNRTLLLETKAEIQESAQLGSGRTHFPVCSRLPSHVTWREKELPSVFYKGHQSYHGGPTLMTSFTFQTILLLTFQASSCDTFFNLQYYWFGYILFANLLIWTNLVLYKLQVTSCICDLTLQYFIVQKINLLLIFMLIRCIFIFI